jgi:hypothetical protein
MPHNHYRALGGESFLDGTPTQTQDEVNNEFFKQNGTYPDGIFSVNEKEEITLVWSADNDETE